MTCLCVIKLPISIRTISAPDNGHASMRLGRWRWPHPRGSGVNVWPTGKLPRDVSVWPRHSRHWAWQFASISFLGKLPAVVWWFFFGFRFVVSTKNGCCVFFLFGGRGPEGISDGDVKKIFQIAKSDLPCKKLKTKASSIGDSTRFNSVWKEKLFAQSLKNLSTFH